MLFSYRCRFLARYISTECALLSFILTKRGTLIYHTRICREEELDFHARYPYIIEDFILELM
jgi:hypothetical protein